jgi:alpha-mannosidase
MGYKVLTVVPVDQAAEGTPASAAGLEISNDSFAVRASAEDGTLTLLDKSSGKTFSGLNRFVDGGDAGDEYNYSPPLKADLFVGAPEQPPEIAVEQSAVAQTLHIQMGYPVPSELTEDRGARRTECVELKLQVRVTLYPKVRRVDIETTVHNRAKDHRLRVHIPTGISTGSAWADSAFDVVSRPAGAPTFGQDWREKPMATWPQQRFVDVHHGSYGLMVASDGLPEYEVLASEDGNTIALTILRCVGWLSRGDLLTRDANAGPTLATPGAQCLGKYKFRYSIVPHTSGWEEAFLHAHHFVTPLRAIQLWGGTPQKGADSLVRVEPAQVVLSAAKQSERSHGRRPELADGLVVRVYNPLPQAANVRLSMGLPFESAVLVNLREELDEEAHAATGARFVPPDQLEMRLEAKRIQTILLR